MQGREHLVGIQPHGKGLVLHILRYGSEVRDAASYFEGLNVEPKQEAVTLAAELINRQKGKFEPEKMPDQYAAAVRELIQAKVENRAPEIVVTPEGEPAAAAVINIMERLKASVQGKGRGKVQEAVRRRMGKEVSKPGATKRKASRASQRRAVH